MKILIQLLCFIQVCCFATCGVVGGDDRDQGYTEAFRLLDERGSKILVETSACGALEFGNWAYENNAILYCVSDRKTSLKEKKRDANQYLENIEWIYEDQIVFLREFPHSIDFLLLSGGEFDLNDPQKIQRYYLEKLLAAIPHFTSNTIVMVDDCGLLNGGKGKLVMEYLINHGWRIAMHGYQVIFII